MAVMLVGDGLGRGFNIASDFLTSDFFWMEGLQFVAPNYYAADLLSIGSPIILQFVGTGFNINSNNDLTTGTINRMLSSLEGKLIWDFQGLSLTVAQLDIWANADDRVGALNGLLGGADDIGGSNFGDTLSGLAGNDRIWGHGGNDALYGDGGNDVLRGGAGNDSLFGGAEHDILAGGEGVNTLAGEAGIDTLLLNGARRVSTITTTVEGSFTIGADSFTSYRGNAVTPRETSGFTSIENFAFTDGRLVFAASDVAMQVTRLYYAATATAADPYGLNFWIDAIAGGTSFRGMATTLTANEFTARYGTLSDAQFVTQLYQNALGRTPSGSEVTAWTNVIAGGTSRADVMLNFAESGEAKARISAIHSAGIWDQDGPAASIARLYQATLDRRPDEAGLSGWRAEFDNGKSLLEITPGFLNSIEFVQLYGNTTNTQFVTLLYNNVLDRAPDIAGLNGWLSQLDGGALTRAQVVLGFSESLEFRLNTMSWIEGGVTFA